jgi:hypothetical protein
MIGSKATRLTDKNNIEDEIEKKIDRKKSLPNFLSNLCLN